MRDILGHHCAKSWSNEKKDFMLKRQTLLEQLKERYIIRDAGWFTFSEHTERIKVWVNYSKMDEFLNLIKTLYPDCEIVEGQHIGTNLFFKRFGKRICNLK